MPLYQSIHTDEHELTFATELQGCVVEIGDRRVRFNVWYTRLQPSDAEIYFIDCPDYYHRSHVYTNDRDEDERFILLQHAAFHVLQRYAWAPDIMHGNDWPTALLPAMLTERYGWDSLFEQTASVFSIHNIAYQGAFAESAIYKAGLSYSGFTPGGPLEFHGAFSFLKAGIAFADMVSTVSPTYAKEIQTAEFGLGMEGILRSRSSDLVGILNGIDTVEWSPDTDKWIPANYSVESLDLKRENKIALLRECGLSVDPDVPVIGIVSRLVAQKGFNLLHPILAPLFETSSVRLIALGSGASEDESFLRWAASVFPDRVHARIGFDERMAHLIEAGSDMFLMPSLYEPCGLNQMYSLAYGTLPIVRKTGGLADTVVDQDESNGSGNGFSFYDFSSYALYSTITRALSCYANKPVWRAMQERGMRADFSWAASAAMYKDLYHAARLRRGVA